MPLTRRELIQNGAVGAAALAVGGVIGKGLGGGGSEEAQQGDSGLSGQAQKVADARKLSPDDVTRAVKTFVAPGNQHGDEFFLISSGGHSGQVFVLGVPSLRLLKTIGVFTPEPWQGHGYGSDSSSPVIKAGTTNPANGTLTWGDTHHPALSETKGEYDGRYVYINDRANGRIAMIDLRDFKTKQILDVPNLQSSHGGVFVTQDTEYVHISTKTPTLVDPSKADGALDRFADAFRGYSTFLAIDKKGRFDMARSFQVELPPYTQDLSDSGKLVSHGWVFLNSYNSEMSSGGNMEGKPAIETGASKGDYDFMHLINWKKAAELVAAGKTKTINGMRVIPLDAAAARAIGTRPVRCMRRGGVRATRSRRNWATLRSRNWLPRMKRSRSGRPVPVSLPTSNRWNAAAYAIRVRVRAGADAQRVSRDGSDPWRGTRGRPLPRQRARTALRTATSGSSTRPCSLRPRAASR